MNHDHLAYSAVQPRSRPRRRQATTALELLAALTLLCSLLAVAVPLVVRHGQLLTGARHCRLAVDELANQLDRLTALPQNQLPAKLAHLTPTPFTADHLPSAELTGELHTADVGHRITLHITWDETRRRAAPLSMAAWVVPEPLSVGGPRSGGTD